MNSVKQKIIEKGLHQIRSLNSGVQREFYSFSKFLFQAMKLLNTCDSNLYTENMRGTTYFVKRPWIKRPLK